MGDILIKDGEIGEVVDKPVEEKPIEPVIVSDGIAEKDPVLTLTAMRVKKTTGVIETGEKISAVKSRIENIETIHAELTKKGMSIEDQAAYLEEAFISGIYGRNQHFLRSDYYEILKSIEEGTVAQLKEVQIGEEL